MTFIWEVSKGLTVWGVGSLDILMPALPRCQIAGDSFSQQLHTDPPQAREESRMPLAQGGRKAQAQVELCHHPLLQELIAAGFSEAGKESLPGRSSGEARLFGVGTAMSRDTWVLCASCPVTSFPHSTCTGLQSWESHGSSHSWTSNGGICWRLDSNSKITQTRRYETCWKRGTITKNGHLGYLGISLWFRVTRQGREKRDFIDLKSKLLTKP